MIVVNLMGGLGNQMFQYACGVALEAATGQKVRYAMDIYKQQSTFNGYELNTVFGLTLPSATQSDLKHVLGSYRASQYVRRAAMKYQRLEWILPRTAVFERNFAFEPEMAVKLGSCGYLHGYWQSEDYFTKVKERVRNSFQFQGVDHVSLDETGTTNVSLHVRRGDYMNAGSVHATCNQDYYQRALETIGLSLQETVLHVFSDDPTWAKQEISELHPNCRFIEGNHGNDSYKDMYLMSQCDHHVIANSSFSWWGAWLNPSPDKKVIAPKEWFVDRKTKSVNITPKTWKLV